MFLIFSVFKKSICFGRVLPCVRALSLLLLTLTLNPPLLLHQIPPGNSLLLGPSTPPTLPLLSFSLYLRLHAPQYSNNARQSRLPSLGERSHPHVDRVARVYDWGGTGGVAGGRSGPTVHAFVGRTHAHPVLCTCVCTAPCSHVHGSTGHNINIC